MGRLRTDQMHARGDTICGLQMKMRNAMAAVEMQIGNTEHRATMNSYTGFGGLVSMTT